MTNQHEVGDLDALFFNCVEGKTSPEAILANYGPHIDLWPSNARTLGFGREGLSAPAATCIAAVGALTVRAEAGEQPSFSSYGSEIAATLSSTTSKAALESLRQGRPLVATLAIAANLDNPRAQPSLHAALDHIDSIGGETSSSKVSSANELYFGDGASMRRNAKSALDDFLVRIYHSLGAAPSDPDKRAVFTYTALINMADGHRMGRGTAAKVWRNQLVRACHNIMRHLPPGYTLDKVIPPASYAKFAESSDWGIVGELTGSSDGMSFGSLEQRKRSVAEAAQLNFTDGLPSNYNYAPPSAEDPEVNPHSFTGQRIQRLGQSATYGYLGVIAQHLENYKRCRDITMREQDRLEQQRQAVERATTAQGQRILDLVPHVKPKTVARVNTIERRTREMMTAIQDPAQMSPEAVVQTVIAQAGPAAASREGLTDQLAAAAAVISAQRSDPNAPAAQLREAQQVITNNRPALAKHLIVTVSTLIESRLSDVSAELLQSFGIDRAQALGYEKSEAKRQGGNIVRLDGVPLYILQLAADVLNDNQHSVMPRTPKPKVRGKQVDPARYEELVETQGRGGPMPIVNPRTGEESVKSVRKASPAEEEYMATRARYEHWQTDEANIQHVTATLKTFVRRRYKTDTNDPRVIAALTECALAEEKNFWELPAIQAQVAQRAQKIFANVPREALPESVLPLVDRTMSIPVDSQSRLDTVKGVGKNVVGKVSNLPLSKRIPFRRKEE